MTRVQPPLVRPFTLSRPFTYSVTVHIALVDIIIESSFIYFANAYSAILYVHSNSIVGTVSLISPSYAWLKIYFTYWRNKNCFLCLNGSSLGYTQNGMDTIQNGNFVCVRLGFEKWTWHTRASQKYAISSKEHPHYR